MYKSSEENRESRIRSVVVVALFWLPAFLTLCSLLWIRIQPQAKVPFHWAPNGDPTSWAPASVVFLSLATVSVLCALIATVSFLVARCRQRSTWASGVFEVCAIISGIGFPAWIVSAASTNGTQVPLIWIIAFPVAGAFFGHVVARWASALVTPPGLANADVD